MTSDFLKFAKGTTDLDSHVREYWKQCSYQERYDEVSNYIQQQTGYPPSSNMQFIRELEFFITDKTTLFDISLLIPIIKKEFVIDCFQISIDRIENKAHLLFDWYDRKNNKQIYLYPTILYRLQALIIRTLNLPYLDSDDKLSYYLMLEDYLQNKSIYNDILDWVKHQNPSPRTYKILKNIIYYITTLCHRTLD